MSEAPKPSRGRAVAGVSAGALALAVALIAGREGEVRHTYVDKLGKGEPLTACYGQVGEGVVAGKVYTHAECMAMLQASAAIHAAEIAPCLPAELPDATRAAFIDFGYNIGSAGACKSSAFRKARAGDLAGACAAMGLYVFTGGRDCRVTSNHCGGIVRRRADEMALCRQEFAK